MSSQRKGNCPRCGATDVVLMSNLWPKQEWSFLCPACTIHCEQAPIAQLETEIEECSAELDIREDPLHNDVWREAMEQRREKVKQRTAFIRAVVLQFKVAVSS